MFTGQFIKQNGVLKHKTPQLEKNFNEFKTNLPENAIVDVYMEHSTNDGTLSQLAKIHSLIRILSQELGYNFADIKLLVKDKAGLILKREVQNKEFFIPKSFGDCSKSELSLVIQTCIDLGKTVNLNLY